MGKHVKIESSERVASVLVPTPLSGLPKQLQSQEWRKDLLMSWLFQTCIRLQTSLDHRFLRFGMTVQEAGVLLRCVETRSVTPGQLAVVLGRDKAMITRFINRLEVSRLIGRHNNPRDRRFSVIRPTTKGKQLARELANVFEHIRKELFAGMLESDIRGLSRMMALLHKNAVGIGSRQKCDVVRQRRRIGRRKIKAEAQQTIQPRWPGHIDAPLADNWTAFKQG
jgi:DNA-binding MarR family transcriptional regulator